MKFSFFLLLMLSVMQLATSCSTAESRKHESALQAYYKDFPYQDTHDYFVRYTKGKASLINKWSLGLKPILVKAGQDKVVRMNNDTYYKMSFVHLAKGPVVLSSKKADKNRFSSFQLMDDHNANFKNVIHPKGKYTLYHGKRPKNIKGVAIEAPSELMVVIVRVEVKDKANRKDTKQAKKIFKGIKIKGPRYTKFPKANYMSAHSEEIQKEGMKNIKEAFKTTPFMDTVAAPADVPSKVSYLSFAAGTQGGWGGPVTSHSSYETLFFDGDKEVLDGKNGDYTVTTSEPPVKAFWSLTVYDTERGGFFHPNKFDTYHINNTTAVKNADGTVTFLFKKSCSKSTKNCLEIPNGKFDVVARYYLPEMTIRSGEWKRPGFNIVK